MVASRYTEGSWLALDMAESSITAGTDEPTTICEGCAPVFLTERAFAWRLNLSTSFRRIDDERMVMMMALMISMLLAILMLEKE